MPNPLATPPCPDIGSAMLMSATLTATGENGRSGILSALRFGLTDSCRWRSGMDTNKSPTSGKISRKAVLAATAAVGAASVLGNGVIEAATVLVKRAEGNRSEIHGNIVIGSSLPLTGFLASDGKEMLRGFTLAIEEINAKGGILGAKVKHKYYDVGNMAPDAMVSNFRRLIYEDNVHAILCGYHTGTGPEYPLVAQAGMP